MFGGGIGIICGIAIITFSNRWAKRSEDINWVKVNYNKNFDRWLKFCKKIVE